MAETMPVRGVASDDPRWAAVVRRDRAADGRYVYAVSTTGIYCRPSCGARRAKPEHVAFYASCAAAETAGFRPCKRCKPDALAPDQRRAAEVVDLCRWLDSLDTIPSLQAIAIKAGKSPYHLHRWFKAQTGLTPRVYALARRAQRLRDELERGTTVTDAVYAAGFNSSGRFYASAPATLGMTPRDYRAGGPGRAIRFAVGECSLGAILVACSDVGVCAIALGDDPERLAQELQDRFPRAAIAGGDAAFEALVAKVVGLVEAPQTGVDLPLDIRGTVFQQRVWQALRKVPVGATLSYTELAALIGAPQSVRAVARACAANPLAVAIPCHRVVRLDGSVSGYRWGVARKRELLRREAGLLGK